MKPIFILFILWIIGHANVLATDCSSILRSLDVNKQQNYQSSVSYADPYRWMETPSERRRVWLNKQNQRTQNYLKNAPESVYEYWHQTFKKIYDKPTAKRSFKVDTLTEVKVMDMGLNKPDKVNVYTNGKLTKVLFDSTKDTRLKQHMGIMNLWHDPLKEYVLVPVSYNGSTDLIDIHIYHIQSGELVDLIANANNREPTWITPTKYVYRKLLQRDYISITREIGSKTDEIHRFSYRAPLNSPSKQFAFIKEGKFTAIKSIFSDHPLYHMTFELTNIHAQTPSAFYITKMEDGFEQLYRLSKSFDRTPLLIPTPKGVLKTIYTDGENAFAYYRLGKDKWGILLDKDSGIKANVPIPDCCELMGFKYINETKLNLSFTSAIKPFKSFSYDLKNHRYTQDISSIMQTDEFGREFTTEYITAQSQDGGSFPIRVTHLKEIPLDGQNPSLVEAYGGFGAPGRLYPNYSLRIKKFMDHGGVHVAPAIRGGNELGPQWRQGAVGENKQNTFNDMYATLQTLHQKGYSSPEKTAIMGWSNGGLLIGAMSTQFAQSFKLGIVGNGVLDMLRKDLLDPRFDNGWSYEYGTSMDDYQFEFLKKYSPVHNAKPQHYPSILVVSGLSDSRVNPIHSFKFTAALQDAQQGTNPIMLLPVKDSGHWVTSQDLEDSHAFDSLLAIWTTIYQELGIEIP